MEKRNVFSAEKDVLLNKTCKRVIAFLRIILLKKESIYFKKSLTCLLNKDSIINSFVEEKKWQELFENKEWLNLLKVSQLVCADYHKDNEVVDCLRFFCDFFPEETKGYLTKDSLLKECECCGSRSLTTYNGDIGTQCNICGKWIKNFID